MLSLLTVSFWISAITVVLKAFGAIVATAVLGGFIAGVHHCKDAKNVWDRIFLGAIWAFLSPLGFGFLPSEQQGGVRINTWKYGVPAAAALCLGWKGVQASWWLG